MTWGRMNGEKGKGLRSGGSNRGIWRSLGCRSERHRSQGWCWDVTGAGSAPFTTMTGRRKAFQGTWSPIPVMGDLPWCPGADWGPRRDTSPSCGFSFQQTQQPPVTREKSTCFLVTTSPAFTSHRANQENEPRASQAAQVHVPPYFPSWESSMRCRTLPSLQATYIYWRGW